MLYALPTGLFERKIYRGRKFIILLLFFRFCLEVSGSKHRTRLSCRVKSCFDRLLGSRRAPQQASFPLTEQVVGRIRLVLLRMHPVWLGGQV